MTENISPPALQAIANLAKPCPPPDLENWRDMCPAHPDQPWPCNETKIAWLARGLDVTEQTRAAFAALRSPRG